jgi:hypothetical protein
MIFKGYGNSVSMETRMETLTQSIDEKQQVSMESVEVNLEQSFPVSSLFREGNMETPGNFQEIKSDVFKPEFIRVTSNVIENGKRVTEYFHKVRGVRGRSI